MIKASNSAGLKISETMDQLADKIQRVDLVVSDLDHCIFPGYSQAYLSALTGLLILIKPKKRRDRAHIPRLMRGALFMSRYKIRQLCGLRVPTDHMIASYEKTMRGIPAYYFRTISRALPRKSYPGAKELLCFFARQAPVGIISLGIEPVCTAYRALFRGKNGPCISFFDANRLVFSENSGRPVFRSFFAEKLMTNGEHKRTALLRRIRQYRSQCPLIIGNSEDDVLMAEHARQCGGLGIGWNPDKKIETGFDLIVRGRSWYPLLKRLQGLT